MAKVHIVREPFALDGKYYNRGDEIRDVAELAKVKETHSNHLTATNRDAVPESMGE